MNWYASADDVSRLDEDMIGLLRMHRQSDEEKSEFMTPEMEEWFRAPGRGPSSRGAMRLYFLELDGKRVAGTIALSMGSSSFCTIAATTRATVLSVGLALKAYSIHDAIESGFEVFDFLQGSESYKYDLGAFGRADLPRQAGPPEVTGEWRVPPLTPTES